MPGREEQTAPVFPRSMRRSAGTDEVWWPYGRQALPAGTKRENGCAYVLGLYCMMPALVHELFALLDGVHELLGNGFGGGLVVYLEWGFKRNGKPGSLLFQS